MRPAEVPSVTRPASESIAEGKAPLLAVAEVQDANVADRVRTKQQQMLIRMRVDMS